MAQTKEGARKARETLMAKYGGKEGFREHMRTIGGTGGAAIPTKPRGFATMDKAKLLEIATRGGAASRKKKTTT